MRFAITMLSVVAIASIIGTVVKQSEPYNNYLVQFGQFWFPIFEVFDVYNIYQAFWFLIILLFLVVSTSLCVSRNSPKIIKDIRRFQGSLSHSSFKKFKNYYEFSSDKSLNTLTEILNKAGFRIKASKDKDILVAKKGDLQKLGYIFTHLAIIVISIGGILDGNLYFKLQESFGFKKIESRNLKFSEVPAESQLDIDNFSYRATLLLNEQEKNNKALLRMKDGYLVQHLPFEIKLDKFHIEHYSTGQPKAFLSDIKIRKDGQEFTETISVNKPFTMDGITIYQSDFQDGGSRLDLTLMDLFNRYQPINLSSEVYKQNSFNTDQQEYVFEFDDFREFNIFQIEKDGKLKTQNIGPSVVYKFRNASGQAVEYQTYQNPIPENEKFFFMSGVREDLQSELKFLRIPADSDLSLQGYQTFLKNIRSEELLLKNINLLADQASSLNSVEAKENFKKNTQDIFNVYLKSGYSGLAAMIEDTVALENQESVADSYIKIIYFLAESMNQKLITNNIIENDFLQDALNAYSDSFFYGDSPFLILNEYEKIYASGMQLTKDPGKIWVYIGSLFLVIGIFCMIYVQEIRLWLIKKSPRKYAVAMASNREHIDFDNYCKNLTEKFKTKE
ncbi:MAG: cytochrome c biogenesis protein ResB [Methylophilaceae bacterium]|nr:cytochrome c biogenesis protein ResB [Betaproteobacteria bacterium]